MLDSNQILKLLPNIDCGLCNNPSCASLARKISRNRQEIGDCPLVKKDNLKRVSQLVRDSEPVKSGSSKNMEEYYEDEIIEIQPCAEYGRVTLEAHLIRPENSIFDLFDSCDMCQSFSNISSLENVKCSLEMGYGLAEKDERRIHVFKTGKIMIRRATDRADAFRTLKLVSYSLGPSIICSCGNTLADCLGGGCTDCSEDLNSGLSWLFSNFKPGVKPVSELFSSIIEKINLNQENGRSAGSAGNIPEAKSDKINDDMHHFRLAWSSLNRSLEHFKIIDDLVKNNEFGEFESHRDSLIEELREITKYCNEHLVFDLDLPPRTESLVILGICRNLRRLIDSYISLTEFDFGVDWMDRYNIASSFIFKGFSAFISCDEKSAASIEIESKGFLDKLQSEMVSENFPMEKVYLYKIAKNGYFISRMIRMPVTV